MTKKKAQPRSVIMEAQPTTKHERVCLVEMITPREQIRKFFFEKHFDFLTSVPQRRLQEIILSSCVKGNSGKMMDYAETGTAHRTTYGHFLAKGKWDDKRLEEMQKRESFQTTLELSHSKGAPLFVSIDDTVLPKTVPSSKAKRPTEAAGWHYSHLEGKVIYGYQVHAAIVGTGDTSLCYSLKRCCPENGTKIDMTLDVIQSLPEDAGAYVLMDSWYTNPGVLDACRKKGCHLIGALKTNRILYPEGKRTSAADLASSLDPGCFHPVTVKGRAYMVSRYEGALNKIDCAVVLLSYPAGAVGKKHALRVFLCSDTSLSNQTILDYYAHRWTIEVLFRSHKRYFGLKSFMVRAAKAIDRLLLILAVAHFFFSAGLGLMLPFPAGLRLCRASFVNF